MRQKMRLNLVFVFRYNVDIDPNQSYYCYNKLTECMLDQKND